MQTALRKMGNSTGIILPRSILGQIGLTTGAALDLRVENGTLIGTPVRSDRRENWAGAAAAISDDENEEEKAWREFGNDGDADLIW
jgi:antitoxin MazE